MAAWNRRSTIKGIGALGAAAALPGCSDPPKDAQVIVVGAGLAGLSAAVTMQDAGLDVLVLEADTRVGGRVYTIRQDGYIIDAGGSEFSVKSYARVVDMVNRLQLTMTPWRGNGIQFALHVNDLTLRGEDWPESPANRVVGAARNLPPAALASVYRERPVPLADLEAWLKPSSAGLDIGYGEYLRERGAGEEALRLIGNRARAATLDGVSALWELRAAKFGEVSGGVEPLRNLADGMGALTDGMAGLLARAPQLNTPVTALRMTNGDVEIETASGQVLRSDFAVCTAPLPVLRTMEIYPPLPALQAAAVEEIPYDGHAEVFLRIDEPYWEDDNLPSSLWTDTPLGIALHIEQPGSPGFLWVPLAGPLSEPWRDLSDSDLSATVLQELNRVRPSTKGRVTPLALHNWNRGAWSRGHLAYRAPGQITRFGDVLTTPHGRVHFAGEHTAQLASGMEGAMESGQRAALEILSRFG